MWSLVDLVEHVVVASTLSAVVRANPFPQATSTTSSAFDPTNPCAQVSKLFANATQFYPKVPANLAWRCLKDVPFDVSSASPWLQSIRPYMDWQTTTSYLKDPPPEYPQPAYDVLAEFDRITADVASDNYENEYDFEMDLYFLFQRSYDGHFRYIPILAGGIFGFGRPVSLISYSADGFEAPRPYVYSEVLSFLVNGTSKPSAVTQIDGQDAVEHLQDLSQYGTLQDPDALYNNMFYSLAQASLGAEGSGAGAFAGGGRGAYVYPGATTTLTFENRTTTTYENFAIVLAPFRNISSGADLFHNFVNRSATTTSQLTSVRNQFKINSGADQALKVGISDSEFSHMSLTNSTPPTVYPRAGYPPPVANTKTYNYVAGFYLDEPGQEDVAGLAISSFVGTPDFQDVVYDFLDQAAKDGKTKLIIDLSANGGGVIMQGYNLFLNLFPGVLPYGASRFRYHEAFNLIGETVSERIWKYPFNYSHVNPYWLDFAGGSPFDYRADVNVNYENFASWQEKAPPNFFMNDTFTSIIRWNLSDPLIEVVNDIQPNGFGDRVGMPAAQLFTPDNIVLLYDGYCASTCALFSELMTQQGGVKTVSVGGRPNGGVMQTVGGTKGANNYDWWLIQRLVQDTYALAPDQVGFFNKSALENYLDPDTGTIYDYRGYGSVNVRDAIREGDSTQTPLQFIFDAADCRLYYTAEMTVDVSAMWEKVADVAWNGDSCVVGGFSDGAAKRSWGDAKDAAQLEAQSKAKAARRLQKRKMQMTTAKLNAIKESLNIVTDARTIEPLQGLMLP